MLADYKTCCIPLLVCSVSEFPAVHGSNLITLLIVALFSVPSAANFKKMKEHDSKTQK